MRTQHRAHPDDPRRQPAALAGGDRRAVRAASKASSLDADGGREVIADAVAEVVRRQVETGIDVVSDGEMSKISYATYIADRLSGFDGDTPREPGQDLVEFPRFLKKLAASGATAKYRAPALRGADRAEEPRGRSKTDIANFRSAADAARRRRGLHERGVARASSRCSSRTITTRRQDAYLEALAEAMRAEYEAHRRRRLPAADRRAGSRHGPPHDVPRRAASRST